MYSMDHATHDSSGDATGGNSIRLIACNFYELCVSNFINRRSSVALIIVHFSFTRATYSDLLSTRRDSVSVEMNRKLKYHRNNLKCRLYYKMNCNNIVSL